jgi:NADPH:quinone reductase-like Zn-dependent oxidoreductase
MKAVVCTKYGPPEVLQLMEVAKPAPKNKEVLVRVYATAVTASDCIMRGATLRLIPGLLMRVVLGFTKPRKSILGLVVAGDIEAVGKDATRFRPGDQVYGFTGFGFGSYAEYTCMPEEESIRGCLASKPVTIGYEQAAAVPYGAMLAMHFLKIGNIQPGQNVLIYGASGAIGTTAVQIAKHYGAEVTGVCSTTNLDLVKSLGADNVVDYTTQDSLTGDERYDFVLDAVGKRKSSKLKLQCRNALTPNGKYMSVDDAMPKARVEYLVLLKELIESGRFKPVIDRTYPLEQLVDAHRYVDEGHKRGNVVVTVENGNKT